MTPTERRAMTARDPDDAAPTAAPIALAIPEIDESDVAAVERVLRSGWITTGEECARLEAELADYLGVPHVLATSSCTAALEIALAHLGLPAGSRVGVPTWTFVSTALVAVHAGHEPVLLDVDPDDLNLSATALGAALEGPGLDAVIGVHFGGVPFGSAVHETCRAHEVPLIEDAAHALGAGDARGRVAGQGTAGACFSFYATKNLTSGEGGALATDDPALAEFAASYRLHGLSRDAWARYRPGSAGGYDVEVPGIKGNLPDILAALARSQLARFDRLQARRRALVEGYRAALADVDGLRFVPGALAPLGADHLLVVLLPEGTDRDVVRKHLQSAGIGTSVHFQPLHDLAWFRAHAIERGPGGTPNADAARDRALSLPLHPGLRDADVERICTELVGVLGP